MKNNTEIREDGNCVYAVISSDAHLGGRLLLLFVIGLLIGIGAFALSTDGDDENMTRNVIISVLAIFIITAFPLKWLVWNVWGKEILTISAGILQYQYSFRLAKTNVKTLNFDEIRLDFEPVKEIPGTTFGQIKFYSSDKKGMPCLLYTTRLTMPEASAREFADAVHSVISR